MKTIKEIKILYPLLKETYYIHKMTYKKLMKTDINWSIVNNSYNYALIQYEKNLTNFKALELHLKTSLPTFWLQGLGNPNLIEATKYNTKKIKSMLDSGFYKPLYYKYNSKISMIILIDQIPTYDSYTEILEKRSQDIKDVFKQIGNTLKKMGL